MEIDFDFVYNEETGEWENKKEPFAVIECKTKEDYEYIQKALNFYNKKYKGEKNV